MSDETRTVTVSVPTLEQLAPWYRLAKDWGITSADVQRIE